MQKPFRYNKVLSELIARFPLAFSRNPRGVVPLGTNTLSEISRVLGIDGIDLEPYRTALDIYQRSTAYITVVALGRKRRTLWGGKFPALIPPVDRERARAELQRRGVWSEDLEHHYRSKIGHFVQLESNSPSAQSHDERHAKWVGRLHGAGFTDADIAIIQQQDFNNTDDFDATRRKLEEFRSSV